MRKQRLGKGREFVQGHLQDNGRDQTQAFLSPSPVLYSLDHTADFAGIYQFFQCFWRKLPRHFVLIQLKYFACFILFWLYCFVYCLYITNSQNRKSCYDTFWWDWNEFQYISFNKFWLFGTKPNFRISIFHRTKIPFPAQLQFTAVCLLKSSFFFVTATNPQSGLYHNIQLYLEAALVLNISQEKAGAYLKIVGSHYMYGITIVLNPEKINSSNLNQQPKCSMYMHRCFTL